MQVNSLPWFFSEVSAQGHARRVGGQHLDHDLTLFLFEDHSTAMQKPVSSFLPIQIVTRDKTLLAFQEPVDVPDLFRPVCALALQRALARRLPPLPGHVPQLLILRDEPRVLPLAAGPTHASLPLAALIDVSAVY
ncbi:Catechol-2,3-dioxygenase [Pseudomonas syringae pv. actinidiae]|uniref:Catechol-2,3-dioxygenase n=1 Tax=Pseudomonas syringae pv. actinidiae TaxID=103796 RepID=A0A2V0QK25_PSESF|nr:Catechol-2,3-dioxygenase [Pseudomonas syringae pv. actinidiae]